MSDKRLSRRVRIPLQAAIPAAITQDLTMIKLILAAATISLLSACSSMSGTSTTSNSGNASTTMGASGGMQAGTMQNGSGPRGSAGGGPN